jgi:hypothetical protein
MAENTQWEYKIEVVGSFWKGTKPEAVEDYLNQLGEENWEVVCLHSPENSNRVWITIKRPLTASVRRERTREMVDW